MKKPNIFIVGAPKCGTTSLADYLSEHPDIYMPELKEPFFFSKDLPGAMLFKNEQEYLKTYASANAKNILDASPLYLYSEVAAAEIKQFNENAKIIVMLRNPVDVVYSFFTQNVFSMLEDRNIDFRQAWELQEKRACGRMIPSACIEPKLLQYGSLGSFSVQLQRFIDTFERANIKIIIFDDFVADTKAVYESVLDFLGVSQTGRAEFEKKNQNKQQKLTLSPILYNTYMWMRKRGLMDPLRPLISKLKVLNMKQVDREPLDDVFRSELQEYFHNDIVALSDILGRDLNAEWHK